jgi:hypothetical protein
MAILCRERRLLFIMAPRTGCTAVGAALQEHLGGEYLPRESIYRGDGRLDVPYKHCTLRQLTSRGLVTEVMRRELLVFSTVRNPFDSLVSLYVKNATVYQERIDRPSSFLYEREDRHADVRFCATHTFDEWIEHLFGVSKRDRLLGRPVKERTNRYLVGADVVMRFESLQEDFDGVLRRSGVEEQITVPLVNATTDRPRDYRSFYSPKSRDLVERAWRSDLERFGYSF